MYNAFLTLHLQFSTKAEFIPVPDWYLGVEYIEEQKRGYDYSEDLFTPGFFELEQKRRQYSFFCFNKDENPSGLKAKFTKPYQVKFPGTILLIVSGMPHSSLLKKEARIHLF